MFKKVLTVGIIAVWLLIVPAIGHVFSQEQPTPEPAATELATPSPTPTDLATPSPTPTDLATPSPTPTDLATPSPTPTDLATPSPAATTPATTQTQPFVTPAAPSPAVTTPATAPGLTTPVPVPAQPVVPTEAAGQETSEATVTSPIDTGDTAFMLVSSALVLFMTPGLAFFYGGLVRSRNVLNTMMMSLILMAVVGVTWVFWGYSLAFANAYTTAADGTVTVDANPLIGNFDWLFLNNVAHDQPDPIGYAATIPHQMFMVYQMMFAIITPALISGAIVERMSFKAYFWFILLWSTFIYPPLAHWVWGKGWIGAFGALDFAGGTVVHISSGISAVVAVWVLGPRKNFMVRPAAPHNVPYVLLGIGMLWFGWFGFNAGSALGANAIAAVAFVATMVSAAAAGLTWVILEWVLRSKPTAVGIASGFLAGLVGVTPAAGYVNPIGAILIGSLTSVACFFAVSLRAKWQFDDSLDTFPIHGVGGTIGAILTGIFAQKALNSAGDNGLLFNNPAQLIEQLVGVIVTYIFAGLGTFIILKVLGAIMDLRVKPLAEDQGLDINEHGEEGYGEEFASGLSLAKE